MSEIADSLEILKSLQRILTLVDYNSRIVIFGTALIGGTAGVVGSFTLLRKRALIGDAISHSMLPGLGIAFLIGQAAGGDGRWLLGLMMGAVAFGFLGAIVILWIRSMLRLGEDAAFGIVLSVFFGVGVALLGVIQSLQSGHAAGLEGFLYGKTASLNSADLWTIAVVAGFGLLTCTVLFKEFTLLCFDENFAISQGYRRWFLDALLMVLVVCVAVTGMQAVGLILVIALLIIPAASARFWTDNMSWQVVFAGLVGSSGCFLGTVLSAVLPETPSGAVIILTCAMLFFVSLMWGTQQGIFWRWRRRWHWRLALERQHVLRAIYERLETRKSTSTQLDWTGQAISSRDLLVARSWTEASLNTILNRLQREGLVTRTMDQLRLSKRGFVEAERLTHQHRLWEMYLIAYADVAVQNVDNWADDIEHVLEPEVVRELEQLLANRETSLVPESPHQLVEKN